MLPKKVHVIHQLVCLFCSFKKYWFMRERKRESKFTLFVNQERQKERVREWEIASAVQKAKGTCQSFISAQGLWELQQWQFCDTEDIRACSLHHSRPCLSTQPHPRHLPSVTGSSCLTTITSTPSALALLHLSTILCSASSSASLVYGSHPS